MSRGIDMPADISLTDIRPIRGSKRHGFEELCCQLAAYEPQPERAEFIRKGSPDAGVECFWRLRDGTEHGWQAKYFTSAQAIDWRQVDNSVQTALDKHADLTDYTVCFATDLPDPRVSGQTSALERWEQHVEKWQAWATERGMSVQFHFWGEHEIIERLSRPVHGGRLFFWFECPDLTPGWFSRQVQGAIVSSQERYFPDVDVSLEVDKALASVAYDDTFCADLGAFARRLRRSASRLKGNAPASVAERLTDLRTSTGALADRLDDIATPRDAFLWRELGHKAFAGEALASALLDEIHEIAQLAQSQNQREGTDPDFGYVRHHLYVLRSDIGELHGFLQHYGQIAGGGALLVTGEAGSGKTHLFCKIAEDRVARKLPTLLLLGSWYEGGDPWQWIIGKAGLRCDREQFLGALQAAAEAYGCRAIVLVDALNEGNWRGTWREHLPAFLEELTNYDRVCLALSVRTTYERHIIPEGLVADRLVRIEHTGFSGNEYEAVRRYFRHFNIQLPRVPLEFHELSNPLFLRLLCKAISAAGERHIPDGVRGLTSVFDYFISMVDETLSRELDYDPRHRLVGRSIDAVAAAMVERTEGALPYGIAQEIVDGVHHSGTYSRSLFAHLLHWGVLTRTPVYSAEAGESVEAIRFSFERFSDHQIASALIEERVDPTDLQAAFVPTEPLGKLVRGDSGYWSQQSLIEAIAIQVPERFGQELPGLVPDVREEWLMRDAFIESLKWRSPQAFSERTTAYVNEVLVAHGESLDRLLNVLLTVAADPEHPYNADRTHAFLERNPLPHRDHFWSTYLHYHYGKQGAVDRLLDWAQDYEDSSDDDDDVLRLVGTALAWYLTSPNRSLRDRTTKALVRVFDGRVHVLPRLIAPFLDADDPYVIERLFAVAYGCAMRTDDKQALQALAQSVFGWGFADGRPYPHIHTRDYARGVVRTAVERGCILTGDLSLADPPYASEWPDDIPTEEELAPLGEVDQGMPVHMRARGWLYDSVMGFGDFARYVIGTNSGSFAWMSVPLDQPRPRLPEEVAQHFFCQLDDTQTRAWEDYRTAATPRWLAALVSDDVELAEGDPAPLDEQETEALAERALAAFRSTLDSDQLEVFNTIVFPQQTPREESDVDFDVKLIQRFILSRVHELGWSPELHGEFDWWVNRWGGNRFEHASERIGKKYQWIAYHEVLARVADNFHMRGDLWSDDADNYEGPWQVNHGRDIDPSCLLAEQLNSDFEAHSNTWWFPVQHDPWEDPRGHEEWLRDAAGIPDPGRLLEVASNDGERWLALHGYYSWKRERSPDEDDLAMPRREVWYKLWSYLVDRNDAEAVWEWLTHQRIFQYTLPEPHDVTNQVFLGEFHWAPSYQYQHRANDGHADPFEAVFNGHPTLFWHTAEGYMRESAGFDHSIEGTIRLSLPAARLSELLEVRRNLCDGRFADGFGNVVAQDPSAREAGPSTLVAKRDGLVQNLAADDLALVWVIFGEKLFYDPSPCAKNKHLGRLEIGSCHLLERDEICHHLSTRFIEPGDD